jgi:hypothetical protein
MAKKEKAQDVEAFLLHSEFFWRYILRDWARKHPDLMKEMIRKVREDEEAEAEVQRHMEKVAKG